MTGIDALLELSKGKKIRCVSWENPNWHFYFTDGCYFSHQAKEFPKVSNLNPLTPWTNLFNQEIAEELIDDILNEEWEIVDET